MAFWDRQQRQDESAPDDANDSAREAARLYRLPAQWELISDHRLKEVALYGCLYYGCTSDMAEIPRLTKLFAVVNRRLALEHRRQILVDVTTGVEHQLASVNAFLPFMMSDPDLAVVSSAALNMAMLMPLRDGDVLTGPRYLLGDVVHLQQDEHVRVGTLMGLLLLGDRRVTRLLSGCWNSLSPDGRKSLSHARSGFAYASTVEFFLEWLSDAEQRNDEAEFGLVAAALANVRQGSKQPLVLDVERRFPANATNEAPVNVLAQWTFEEFGQQIAPRLVEMYARESEPRVLGHVLKTWGIEVPPAAPA